MSTTWNCKAGDKHRQLAIDLTDLLTTGATAVRFRMQPREGGTLVVDADGVIASATRVTYQFTGTQLDVPGVYLLEVMLTFPDGQETAPTSGHVVVVIEPRLSA